MKRFLRTTAIVATFAGSAFAGTATTASKGMDHKVRPAQSAAAFGEIQPHSNDFFASDLIGMRIYASENDYDTNSTVPADTQAGWNDIGEINDIIVTEAGDIRGVVLGIGGFLGLGEHDVAVQMDDIRVLSEDDDPSEKFLVVQATKESLEAAPEFERSAGVETTYTAEDEDQAMTDKSDEPMQTSDASMSEETDSAIPSAELEGSQSADNLDTDANVLIKETDMEGKTESTADADDMEDEMDMSELEVETELEDS